MSNKNEKLQKNMLNLIFIWITYSIEYPYNFLVRPILGIEVEGEETKTEILYRTIVRESKCVSLFLWILSDEFKTKIKNNYTTQDKE